jgi:hypothetical protein
MAQYTDEVTGCERRVVFAIDVLDTNRQLLSEHVALTSNLASSGFGPQKCSYFQVWVNKQRQAAGKPPLRAGTIKPTTTMRESIDHVCA